MDTFGDERCRNGLRETGVLVQEVTHAKTRERATAVIAKQRLGCSEVDTALGDERSERLNGLGPERTHSLFASLASESDLERPHELEVAWADVENFLDARASVEQREEEGAIAATIQRRAVGRVEEGSDFVRFEILNETVASPFEGHGENALAKLDVFGMAHGGVACECVNGGEARVACGGTVAPIRLEMVEEGKDVVGGEVHQIEPNDSTAAALCKEVQEKNESVAVATHRVRTHAAHLGEVISEEAT
jgi:hypothetical protein